MQTLIENPIDLSLLPDNAQQEIIDFYQFLVAKYSHNPITEIETKAFSNHSANTIEQWHDEKEDEIWT